MSARLRVIVADDERPARSFLVALLRSFEDVAVIGEATSGKEAVAMIEKEKPDLAFLDWQMPELDGMGVVRQLRKQSLPLIAFVTAYDEYAVRAFEVNAVDYLLKPVDKSRLRETLNRAQDRMEHAEIVAEQASRVGQALDAYESSARPPFLERIPGSPSRGSRDRPGAADRVHRRRRRAAEDHDEPQRAAHDYVSPERPRSGCSILPSSFVLVAGRWPTSIRFGKVAVMPGGTHVRDPRQRSEAARQPDPVARPSRAPPEACPDRQPLVVADRPLVRRLGQLVENRAVRGCDFRSVAHTMAPAGGPHTRNPMPGAVHRGSKKRIASLSPFKELPANLWIIVAIAMAMLGLSAATIYRAASNP